MENEKSGWFDGIEIVVKDPLRFKAKLAIGEDAYTTLRIKKMAIDVWDAAGVAATAIGVAKSTAVASTFFAPSGFLAAIGIGTAVTPVGWVIAAGVVTGGAWLGITRHLKKMPNSRVTVIPNFINTPIDVLALGLFDLIVPLALKCADVDGKIDDAERNLINSYFVDEWGYDQQFVNAGMRFTESNLSVFSIKNVALTLAKFGKENPDCNYKLMCDEILTFMQDIIEADGYIDEREELAIERIRSIFHEADKIKVKEKFLSGLGSVKNTASNVFSDGVLSRVKR